MQEKLISFHGKAGIKEQKVNQLKAHRAADEIVQGVYWENGKGCAVGCTVHSSHHSAYETEMGIPRILARLEDRIFEGLPNQNAKDFPLQFIEAVPVGVDLSNVWRKFMIWLLVDEAEGVIRHVKNERTRKAIQDIANAFGDSLTQTVERSKWLELKNAAYAADAAADAYAAAAYAAAAYAAYAAYAAAAAAAYAADAADAAYRQKAREDKYVKMAAKLVQLLSEA